MKNALLILLPVLFFGNCTTKTNSQQPAAVELQLEATQKVYEDSLKTLKLENVTLQQERDALRLRLSLNQQSIQNIQTEYETTNRYFDANDNVIRRYFADSLR